MASTVIKQL